MNITPDHIDRHGGFDGYVKAKRQIFHRQTKPRTAIVGADHPTSGGIYEALKAADEPNVRGISGLRDVPGGHYAPGRVLNDGKPGKRLETYHPPMNTHPPGGPNGTN